MKKFFITTLGCPKNQADSREMERVLHQAGYVQASGLKDAHIHIINSCAFIQSAKEETIGVVFESAENKPENQKLILVGCFSQRYEESVKTEMPEVDLCVGTGRYNSIADIIGTNFPELKVSEKVESALKGLPCYAPVKISEGCSRKCTFCAIPLIRGRQKDIDADAVLQECRKLALEGVREINLVSQDTVSYGDRPEKLIRLISEIQNIEDIFWIRLLYLYPDEKLKKIIKALEGGVKGSFPKVVPYLEVPVQHVSEKILKSMGRSGSFSYYIDLFENARAVIPDVEIRTTFMMGFPAEESSDVEELHRFIDKVRPEKLALFLYSPEEDTASFHFKNQVNGRTAASRMNEIQEHHHSILKEIHRERVGKNYNCLIDGKEDDSLIVRRSQDAPEIDEVVYIDLPKKNIDDNIRNAKIKELKTGDLVFVTITGFQEFDMIGDVLV